MSLVRNPQILCSRTTSCIRTSLKRFTSTQLHLWRTPISIDSTVQDDTRYSNSAPTTQLDTFDTITKLYRGTEPQYHEAIDDQKKSARYVTQVGFVHQLSDITDSDIEVRLEELHDQIHEKLRNIEEELTVTVSRREFREAHDHRYIRSLIRRHLDACKTVKDIYRIVVVVAQRPRTAAQIYDSAQPLTRAFYRAREYALDRRITSAMIGLVAYLRMKGLPIAPEVLSIGVKFAARSRDLSLMRRFLREIRKSRERMRGKLFRAIIAKCSVGRRGFGEVRNGRWRKCDLLAVLLGPLHDPVKGEKPYNLEVFLDRSDWQYLHGWVVILARCRAADAIWREWELWRDSEKRRRGHWMTKVRMDHYKHFTYRSRGDNWFVRHLLIAGSPELAWKCLKESRVGFFGLTRQVRSVLLEHLEYATEWNENMRQELLRKYEEDLEAIERRLGVRWIKINNEQGYHRPEPDMADKLEQLTRRGYFKVHGFFTEKDDGDIEDQTVRKYQLVT